MTTTAQPTDVSDDENEHEEPENACLRRELGLRPIYYSNNDTKAAHPDQRPCPSWCWVGQHPLYGHEIDHDTPMVANHIMDTNPSVAASLYEADWSRGEGERYIHVATIEPRLEQAGQGDPVIKVALRWFEHEHEHEHEHLRLSLDEARELVTALDYLVKVAERG